MSIYFEKARELGDLILRSEQSLNLADATTNFNNDPQAKVKMEEYNAYRNNIQQSMQENAITQEEVQKASQNLTEMAIALKQDPVIGALVFAENEFNGFVNQIMDVLKHTITGQPLEEAGGCAGCAGCGQDGCKSNQPSDS